MPNRSNFFLIYSVLNNLGAKKVLIKSKKLVNFDFKQKPRSKKVIYKKKSSESLEGSPPPEFPNTLTQGRIWGGGGVGVYAPSSQGSDPLPTQRVLPLYYFKISIFGEGT